MYKSNDKKMRTIKEQASYYCFGRSQGKQNILVNCVKDIVIHAITRITISLFVCITLFIYNTTYYCIRNKELYVITYSKAGVDRRPRIDQLALFVNIDHLAKSRRFFSLISSSVYVCTSY